MVVGLNTDSSIKRIKGEKRPILNEHERSSILSGLSSVDMVIFFNENTPIRLIEAVRPNILVKGADYSSDEVVGRKLVESYGGRVELIPLQEGFSTTNIINKILQAS